MRREFCDRCGVLGGSKTERLSDPNAAKVVRVTWLPLARVMDLCGPCRKDLDHFLDYFLCAVQVDEDKSWREAVRQKTAERWANSGL